MACGLMAAGVCTLAQTTPELKAFQDAAGNGSVLFRGKQANAYERPANGNPYWSSTTFVPGEIVFEGRFYNDILVNIDAITGQVLVRKSDNPIAIALPKASVSSITTETSRFEWIPDGTEGLPEGLYEVMGNGREKVYKHVSKRLQTSPQNMNGDPIGYSDPAYRSEVSDYYAISKSYYFKDRDGRFSRIRGRGALIRKFPERRGEIRKAMSAAGYDVPGIDFDAFCMMVLNTVAR
jgi:hypothetical protein